MHDCHDLCAINFSGALTSTTSLVWRTADLSVKLADTSGPSVERARIEAEAVWGEEEGVRKEGREGRRDRAKR